MGISDSLTSAAASVSVWCYGTPSNPDAKNNTMDTTETPSNNNSSGSYYWMLQSAVDSTNAAASSLYESLIYGGSTLSPPSLDEDEKNQAIPSSPNASSLPQNNRFRGWNLQNPYSNIRGGNQYQSSSLDAVRSLLRDVPSASNNVDQHNNNISKPDDGLMEREETTSSLEMSVSSLDIQQQQQQKPFLSRNESASQLAEGTIRALRDLELQEAAELHTALEYWTRRWERPLLSWLEAGPWVWFSKEGYNHNLVGQRVSQIQAVLARRLAAIGELQQHLLRAGWQKGVAQWGVLGQGEQWANVAGADGAIQNEEEECTKKNKLSDLRSRRFSTATSMEQMPLPESTFDQHHLPHNVNASLYYGHTSNVNVRKTVGGSVVVDDSALAAWSVDAIWVVRDQLYKASIGLVQLPFAENWKEVDESDDTGGEIITESSEAGSSSTPLPTWATRQKKMSWTESRETEMGIDTILEDGEEQAVEDTHVTAGEELVLERLPLEEVIAQTEEKAALEQKEEGKVVVTDLNSMALEVSELLNSMEVVIEMQRGRRLEKLKGLPMIRRNWYMAAIGAPITTYLVHRLLKDGQAVAVARFAVDRIVSFFNEHVYQPVSAILGELFSRKDRETIIDHKARLDAIESLKKMIESWLEETFKDTFSVEEIRERAESMDMSLIEQKKEENMKTIFEINSVVRMSLIEMQFIKKELLNALYAIDDMMLSNEINMNLAAVTPAVLLMYLVNKTFRFMFYALLKVRKSREETYSSFRHIILDMDRLLLMRDNPPLAPPPLTWNENGEPITTVVESSPKEPRGPCVLNADDLGMLMLHIHECRTILYEDRRRFSLKTLRNVAEDLAELAGERGPVSVEQQLQIISRMCRTYPFLKVGAKASA